MGHLALHVDDLADAAAAEDVLAVGDDGVCHVLHADGALFLALDDELEGLLQECAVLVVEGYHVLVLEELEEVGDALFAESPVVAPAPVSVVATERRRGLTSGEAGEVSRGQTGIYPFGRFWNGLGTPSRAPCASDPATYQQPPPGVPRVTYSNTSYFFFSSGQNVMR